MKFLVSLLVLLLFGALIIFADTGAAQQPTNSQPLPIPSASPTAVFFATITGAPIQFNHQLTRNGQPVTSRCSFFFSLWDVANQGTQHGSTLKYINRPIVNGKVSFELKFGDAFDGNATWVQAEVKCAGDRHFALFGPRFSYTPDTYTLMRLPDTTP